MERSFRQSIQNSRCPALKSSVALLGLIVLGIVAPSPHPTHGAELSAAQKEYLKKLDLPVLLRGDYFKAITIAYKDFAKRLERDEFKSKVFGGEEATTLQWLSRIENYEIHIDQTDTEFIVYFSPTVRGDAPIILGLRRPANAQFSLLRCRNYRPRKSDGPCRIGPSSFVEAL